MIDLGTFATGVLAGLGVGGLIAALLKRVFEEGISNWFKVLQQNRGLVGQVEIQYRQQQLSEFYGPLYAYLKGSETLYRLWMAGKLYHVNAQVKQTLREQNVAMLNIIRSKTHLIDEASFPLELARFMTSVMIWNLYISQQDEVPKEVADLPETKFPHEFQSYIFEKTEKLKEALEGLYKKYGVK